MGGEGAGSPTEGKSTKCPESPRSTGPGHCGTCGERRASQGVRSTQPHQRPLFKSLALLQARGGLPLGSGHVVRVLMSLGLYPGTHSSAAASPPAARQAGLALPGRGLERRNLVA